MSGVSHRAVFLSYASQDATAAQRLCEALRAAGVEVWFDQSELAGGDAWDAKIRRQIAACGLFLPVISANTQARLEGYFRIEWRLAAQRTHAMAEEKAFLVPVVVDDTRDADAKVPVEFKAKQWTRLPGGEPSAAFVGRVQTLLAGSSAGEAGCPHPTPEGSRSPSPPASPRTDIATPTAGPGAGGRRLRWISVLTAVVAGVAIAGWASRQRGGSGEGTPVQGSIRAGAKLASDAANERSIAVLAFRNLSGDPSREFFSDGLSEAMSDVLARVPGLRVAGTTSAFSFKGQAVSIPDIARQLGVSHVVDGTVLQEGANVRITVKLLKADGFQVWVSDGLDREIKNSFALYDEVAGLIATQLALKLGVIRATARREVSPQALELYLQGRQAWNLRSAQGYARAEQMFLRTLALEPNFPKALSALADVFILQAGGFTETGASNPARRADALRLIGQALELDPDLAEAHASRGLAKSMELELAEAERSLRRAVALNPNYPSARQWLANVLTCTQTIDEALSEARRAAELDPLVPRLQENWTAILLAAGRFSEAERVLERAQRLSPSSSMGIYLKGQLLLHRGLEDEAAALARRQSNPSLAAVILAKAGRRSEAEQLWEGSESAIRSAPSVLMALGRTEDVIAAMEAGRFQTHWLGRQFYYDPWCDRIRDDPRVRQVIARLGLTEAHARAQAWRAAQPREKPASR